MADSSGKITQFDKAHYEQLINFLMNLDSGVNHEPLFLGTSANLKLDSTLNPRFKPGSQNWPVTKNLIAAAGVFGDSVHKRLVALEEDWRAFVKALKDAEEVFKDTEDLATYDAGKFAKDYPDVGKSPA